MHMRLELLRIPILCEVRIFKTTLTKRPIVEQLVRANKYRAAHAVVPTRLIG